MNGRDAIVSASAYTPNKPADSENGSLWREIS